MALRWSAKRLPDSAGSVGVSLAVSAAASLGGRPAAANVAVLTLVSLIGFLIGPPIVGFVAQYFGPRTGIGLLLLPVFAAGVLLSGTLGRTPVTPTGKGPGSDGT